MNPTMDEQFLGTVGALLATAKTETVNNTQEARSSAVHGSAHFMSDQKQTTDEPSSATAGAKTL